MGVREELIVAIGELYHRLKPGTEFKEKGCRIEHLFPPTKDRPSSLKQAQDFAAQFGCKVSLGKDYIKFYRLDF